MEQIAELQIDHNKLKAARGKLAANYVAGEVGVTKQAIYNYEVGLRKPSADVLARLCVLYNIKVDDLLSS